MSDRRSAPRYDLVGPLWGLLELSEQARVVNVSEAGALIETEFPAILDSEQTLRVPVEGQPVVIETRVRHARPEPGDVDRRRHLIGLEFVSPPGPVLQSIEQMKDDEPRGDRMPLPEDETRPNDLVEAGHD